MRPAEPWRPAARWWPRGRLRWVALAAIATLLVHLVAVDTLQRQAQGGWAEPMPPRLQALYVQVLQPQAPVLPPAPALPPPAVVRPSAPWVALPALPPLAPEAAASAPPAPEQAGTAPPPVAMVDQGEPTRGAVEDAAAPPAGAQAVPQAAPEAALEAALDAALDAAPPSPPPSPGPAPAPQPTAEPASQPSSGRDAGPAGSPGPDRFEWPPSTRLRYALTGHWRGPIEGRAQVEWVRQGARYQVHLDIAIGAPFAPLIARQMSSDGRLGPAGLEPGRYDERTRVLWRVPVVQRLVFEPTEVALTTGRRVPRPPGVQDPVSQFVQLAWRFTRDPAQLTPGRTVTLPLALPRRVGDWTYDVREPETLLTAAGPVEAVRLAPRVRARGGMDLVPEVWYAPSLQYLPVRILVRHDDESFVDLVIDRLPEQAAPDPEAPAAPAAATAPAAAPPAATDAAPGPGTEPLTGPTTDPATEPTAPRRRPPRP